jgi:ABC-type transport system substrate-binding protein
MDNSEIQTASGLILDRRQLIAGASALGLSAILGASPAMAQGAPKKGGTLRMGMEGGSPSDSLDPLTYADSIPINMSLMLWNNLVEVADNGDATGELFESWEVKPGAADWIFNVRKGISFTSGKTLDADDIIYSLNIHRGETKSPAKALLAWETDWTDAAEIAHRSMHTLATNSGLGPKCTSRLLWSAESQSPQPADPLSQLFISARPGHLPPRAASEVARSTTS